MTSSEENALIKWALKDDACAIACAVTLFEICQTLDDLWDKDKPVSNTQLLQMMLRAMVILPSNPFYTANMQSVISVIEDAIMQWAAANDIEEKSESDYRREMARVAYVIRSSTNDVLIKLARIVGGYEWEREVALAVREKVYLSSETFQEYIEELRGS
jgi:hypothetical protein